MENIEDKIENVVNSALKSAVTEDRSNWPFKSIEDYRSKTNKRFRMTKEDVANGLSRETAFENFVKKLMTK